MKTREYNSAGLAKKHGLYDPALEHDSCGVGFIARLDGEAQHNLVTDAIQILINLEHRGAIGGDKATGDGAGLLLQLPDTFFLAAVDFSLPERGDYAVAMVFMPSEPVLADRCIKAFEKCTLDEGGEILGWRTVPVSDGHTVCIAVKFERTPTVEEGIQVLDNYRGLQLTNNLPSAPKNPILVRQEIDRPQPRRDRNANNGMSVTVGRIRQCPILDLRMVSVVHNTMRGAASGSILNAELLVASGFVR